MDKQTKVDSEDTLVFEIGAVSEETKGIEVVVFEQASLMPGPFTTP
jgi:hypothetical protein